MQQARASIAADDPQDEKATAESLVLALYREVWNRGDLEAVSHIVAPEYTIHSDPGDPWDGMTLNRAEYRRRVEHTRRAFPDIVFTVAETVATGARVAVRWSAVGTQTGDLPGLPSTGRRLEFSGQTIYELALGQVAGHWQVVDRLGFIQQF